VKQAAEDQAQWMLGADILSHTGVNGSSATQRMDAAGFVRSGSWRTAENIAVQSERGPDGIMDDVAQLHTSLMNSPGHRANILNPDLDYIGIGIELGDFDFSSGTYESVIVTQNFGTTGASVNLDTGAQPEPEPSVDPEPSVVEVSTHRTQGDDTDNELTGTDAAEIIRGEGGDDMISGAGGADKLRGGQGADEIHGGDDNDEVYGGGGDDYIRGDNGNDRVFAGSGEDIVRGGRNNDTLLGGGDNDVIHGGSGDDRINGQAGDDRLYGNSGSDRFMFREDYGTDRILDFEDNVDTIDLSTWNFDSVEDAMGHARQSGNVVIFELSLIHISEPTRPY